MRASHERRPPLSSAASLGDVAFVGVGRLLPLHAGEKAAMGDKEPPLRNHRDKR